MRRFKIWLIGLIGALLFAGFFGVGSRNTGGEHLAVLQAIQASPGTGPTLRIATYNIHYGRGADGRVDLERIADVIRRFNIDLIVLNEVDRNWLRSGRVDQATQLARMTGLAHVHYAPAFVTPGLFLLPPREYGTAILSRIPFVTATHTALPRLGRREPRNVVAIEILAGPNGALPITVWGAHLSTNPTERRLQVDALAASELPGLALLMGDLNARPQQTDVQALRAAGWVDMWEILGNGPGYTFPSHEPEARIDYIFSSPALADAFRWIHVDTSLGSDHFPVIAEIDLTLLDLSSLIGQR